MGVVRRLPPGSVQDIMISLVRESVGKRYIRVLWRRDGEQCYGLGAVSDGPISYLLALLFLPCHYISCGFVCLIGPDPSVNALNGLSNGGKGAQAVSPYTLSTLPITKPWAFSLLFYHCLGCLLDQGLKEVMNAHSCTATGKQIEGREELGHGLVSPQRIFSY